MTAAAKFLNCIDSALRECLIAIFSNQRAVNIKENYFLLHNKNPFIRNAKKECLHSRGNYKLFVEKNKKDFEKTGKKWLTIGERSGIIFNVAANSNDTIMTT